MNFGGLKVLMISSDRQIFTSGSAVSLRMKEYGALVEELHIVVLSDSSHGLREMQLGKNIWVYPTNSSRSFLRPLGAARLGKKIVFDKKFVRGRSLVTTDSIECSWAGLKIKNKWRIPVEVQLHTDPFSPYFSGFQNRVRRFFAKRVLTRADSVRVMSEDLKKKVLNLKSKAIVNVLPIYVEKEKIENMPILFDVHARYPWTFILLTVSRLTVEKNLDLALETLAVVRERFPETGLLMIGSGPEEGSLKLKVKSLKLEGSVEFVGWQNDLGSYYKTANVFLQTSVFEGYGLSLVEAGLSGLPVVTTSVGIAQELEDQKDAYIYPVGRADLMAQGIVDLLENNEKRKNLGFNLKRTLENKLISKSEYLSKLQLAWEETSKKIK